jgi:hypothetical protein
MKLYIVTTILGHFVGAFTHWSDAAPYAAKPRRYSWYEQYAD